MTEEETHEALLEAELEQYKIESMEDPFNEALSSVQDPKKRIGRKQQPGVSPLTLPCWIL